jgi:hypothetical protein
MEKLRRFGSAASSWWRRATRYDTWNVGVISLDRELTAVDQLRALPPPRWLPERPPLYYLADPFPYAQGGRDWLLVEEYGHPKGVYGRIARVDLESDPPALETVISAPTHISYPFTFESEGIVYCAPEMAAARGLVIYRLDANRTWTPVRHILRDRRLVDPTFVREADRWWLFATDTSGGGSEALHLFSADAVEGEWTAHRRNPVKVDRASARPGGRPFRVAGQLYRPSQDCSRTYGGAVNVMAIDELTPDAFREHVALRLEPDAAWPYPDGVHTLVIDGRHIYIDAKRTSYDNLLGLKVWLQGHTFGGERGERV